VKQNEQSYYNLFVYNNLYILCLFLISFLGPQLPLFAQTPSTGEKTAQLTASEILTGQRVMHTFDFEERDVNYLDLPMFWNMVTARRGFPHYAEGKLDDSISHGGSYSFLLISDGGSVGFEYDSRSRNPRRIKIKPGCDFQITCYVHLENTETSRTRLSCAFADRLGRIIPESYYYSKLIAKEDLGPDGWAHVEVYAPGNFPDAQYLSIGLWLLQEEQWNQDVITDSYIYRYDVKALAWFDDITVYQLPRVILRTDKLGNVFESRDPVELLVEVEGVNTLDYEVSMRVYDAMDSLLSQEKWLISGVGTEENTRIITLPDISAGCYRSELLIQSGGKTIATRSLIFGKLGPSFGEITASGMNFGLLVLDEDAGNWPTILRLTQLSNAKMIKLPVWKRAESHNSAAAAEENLDNKLIQLQQNNVEAIATFSEVPEDLAVKLLHGQQSLLDLFSRDSHDWLPQVAVVLAQYARQVPFWQIGTDIFDEDITWDPRIKYVLTTLRTEFEKLIRNPILFTPIPGLLDVNQQQVGNSYVSVAISSLIVPEQIPDYIAEFHKKGMNHIWAVLEPMTDSYISRDNRLIDFAKRIAYAKKSEAQAIFINHPWSEKEYNARLVTEPTELLLIYRTLTDQFGGTRYLGEFELAPGVPVLVFDRDGQGCLFAWNTNYHPEAPPAQSEFGLYLGKTPVEIDLFGNSKPLPMENGIGRIHLTNWPVFLSRVDSRMAMLRASMKWTPAIVDASVARQKVLLSFVNPFRIPISGRLRFQLDESQMNWGVDPVVFNFSLQPNQLFQQEIYLKLPRNEISGRKELTAVIAIDADRAYSFSMPVPFEIELQGIDVSIFARRINQKDLLIQQVVTNNSEADTNLTSFIDFPDGDHQERSIQKLAPGSSTTKSFVFPNAEKWVGNYIRIGLQDPQGSRRVNYQIEIN